MLINSDTILHQMNEIFDKGEVANISALSLTLDLAGFRRMEDDNKFIKQAKVEIDKMTDGSLCATLTEVGIFAYGEEYNSRAMMFDKLTTQVIAGILKEQDAK